MRIERDRFLHLLHRQRSLPLHGRHAGHGNVRRSEIRIDLQSLCSRLLRHVEQLHVAAIAILQEVGLAQPGLSQGEIRICLKHLLKAADGCGNVGFFVGVLQQALSLQELIVFAGRHSRCR